jgi:hypothetical protein
VYRIVVYPDAAEQIDALPEKALLEYAEISAVLAVQPWAGDPQYEGNPDGEVRRWAFGPGHVVYLILEHQREVHIALVQWWG